jgi:hypothetical protein
MTGKMIHSTIIVCLTHRAISLRCIDIVYTAGQGARAVRAAEEPAPPVQRVRGRLWG